MGDYEYSVTLPAESDLDLDFYDTLSEGVQHLDCVGAGKYYFESPKTTTQ